MKFEEKRDALNLSPLEERRMRGNMRIIYEFSGYLCDVNIEHSQKSEEKSE